MKKLLVMFLTMVLVLPSSYAQIPGNGEMSVMGNGRIPYCGIQLPYWVVPTKTGIKIAVFPCYDFVRDEKGKPEVSVMSLENFIRYDNQAFIKDIEEKKISPEQKVLLTIYIEVLNFSDVSREIISSYVVSNLFRTLPDLEKESKSRNWQVEVEICTTKKFTLIPQASSVFKDAVFLLEKPTSQEKISLQGMVESKVAKVLMSGSIVFITNLEIEQYEGGGVRAVHIQDVQATMDNFAKEVGDGGLTISYKAGTLEHRALVTRKGSFENTARKVFLNDTIIQGDARYIEYINKAIENMQKDGYLSFKTSETELAQITADFFQKIKDLTKDGGVLENIELAAEKDELNETQFESFKRLVKALELDIAGKGSKSTKDWFGSSLFSGEGKFGFNKGTSDELYKKEFRKNIARELLNLKEKGCFTIPKDTDLYLITDTKLADVRENIWQLYINEGLKTHSLTANVIDSGKPVVRPSVPDIKLIFEKVLRKYIAAEAEVTVEVGDLKRKKAKYDETLELLKSQLAQVKSGLAPYPDPQKQITEWNVRAQEAENERIVKQKEVADAWRDIRESPVKDCPDLHARAAALYALEKSATERRNYFLSEISKLNALFDTKKELEPKIEQMERNRESKLAECDASLTKLNAELKQIQTKISDCKDKGNFKDEEIAEMRKQINVGLK